MKPLPRAPQHVVHQQSRPVASRDENSRWWLPILGYFGVVAMLAAAGFAYNSYASHATKNSKGRPTTDAEEGAPPPEEEPPAASEPSWLAELGEEGWKGSPVSIVGLQNNTELNGRRGILLGSIEKEHK